MDDSNCGPSEATIRSSGGDEVIQLTSHPPVTTPSSQLYAALPVPPEHQSVRLLDLDPLPEASPLPIQQILNLPLSGRLRVATLTESLCFVAVSYVWGKIGTASPQMKISFTDQNCQLDLTENCHSVLRQLRNRSEGVGSIWIDSICINQEDEREKVGQIAMMQDIYSLAQKVVVWLGDGTDESDRAMRYLDDVGRRGTRLPLHIISARNEKQLGEERKRFSSMAWEDLISRLTNRTLKTDNVQLGEVLDREWVHRSWTFQELILASRPEIMCGTSAITWENFVSAIGVISQNIIGGQRLDTVPESLSVPTLVHWLSLVDLWLDFPRRQLYKDSSHPDHSHDGSDSESPKQIRHGRRPVREGIRWLWQNSRGLPLSLWYFYYTISTTVVVVLPAGWGVGVYEIRSAAKAHGIKGLSWIGILMAMLVGSVLVFVCIGVFVNRWRFVCQGEEQTWMRTETAENDEPRISLKVLDGIRAALRERTTSNPHDKAFSLAGILKAGGANPSTPNYRLPVSETYRYLFRNLLSWEPAALSLLMDAGGAAPVQELSWVPDWTTARPSVWLTSRYRLGYGPSASRWLSGSDFQILPNSELKVTGRYIGETAVITGESDFVSMEGLDGSALEVAFIKNADAFRRWYRDVTVRFASHGRYPVINEKDSLFAALEGWMSDEIRAWKGGLEFYGRTKDYLNFCTMWEVLTSHHYDSRSQRNHDELQLAGLVDKLSDPQNQGARPYMIKAVNRIVAEKRNLFIISGLNSTGWFGSGPLNMKTGDFIFVFPHVPTPMVVRPVTEANQTKRYRVVGAAFVQGFMHGDSWYDPDHRGPEDVFLV